MTETVETAGKVETPPAFTGIKDAMNHYRDDQDAAAAAAVQTQMKTATEGKEASAETKTPEAEPAKAPEKKSRYRLVDEKGETVRDRFKSDGKEILFDDPEKLDTYLGFGYHHNTKGEELKALEESLKAKERQIEESLPMLEELMAAQRDGRITVLKPGETDTAEKVAKVAEEEDDTTFTDPQVLKERQARKALEAEFKTMKDDLKQAKALVFEMAKQKVYAELMSYGKDDLAKLKEIGVI